MFLHLDLLTFKVNSHLRYRCQADSHGRRPFTCMPLEGRRREQTRSLSLSKLINSLPFPKRLTLVSALSQKAASLKLLACHSMQSMWSRKPLSISRGHFCQICNIGQLFGSYVCTCSQEAFVSGGIRGTIVVST